MTMMMLMMMLLLMMTMILSDCSVQKVGNIFHDQPSVWNGKNTVYI